MTNVKVHSFSVPAFIESEISDAELAPIRNKIADIQNNMQEAIPVNHKLAGNIDNEFDLSQIIPYVEKMLIPYVTVYIEEIEHFKKINYLSKNCELYLDALWVNFQKRLEFNPPHDHGGVISFVIWIDIPYTKEDELLAAPGKNKAEKVSGMFSLTWFDPFGNFQCESIQPTNNKMLMFPSKMAHEVYPFYSTDKTRISVSGNFKFRI